MKTLKKVLAIVLSLIFVFSLTACSSAAVKDTADRGTLEVFLDGKSVAKISVADFAKKTAEFTYKDGVLYGKTLKDIMKDTDISKVSAAFSKSSDGYAQYFADPQDLFIATYKVDGENYESIKSDDGKDCFTAVTGSAKAKQVTNIYLLTEAQDWSVKINHNGKESTIGISDFMALKPQYKTLSHKYDGGAAVFEGEFLCVDSKTFWEAQGLTLAEATNDEGCQVFYEEGMDLNVTGYVQSSDSEPELKLNKDLKPNPLKEKSSWLVYYFVLVDGNDHHEIAKADLGLSCISDGTGMRWMTTPVTELNITPAEAE